MTVTPMYSAALR